MFHQLNHASSIVTKKTKACCGSCHFKISRIFIRESSEFSQARIEIFRKRAGEQLRKHKDERRDVETSSEQTINQCKHPRRPPCLRPSPPHSRKTPAVPDDGCLKLSPKRSTFPDIPLFMRRHLGQLTTRQPRGPHTPHGVKPRPN